MHGLPECAGADCAHFPRYRHRIIPLLAILACIPNSLILASDPYLLPEPVAMLCGRKVVLPSLAFLAGSYDWWCFVIIFLMLCGVSFEAVLVGGVPFFSTTLSGISRPS